MENNKNMLEEFNIYYLLKNLWTNRKTLIICISFFAVSSIIYSLVVDQEFEVTLYRTTLQ
jgi:LPS O-antigen subunit length determinant protein (WzzB/FepE family)